LHGFFEVLRTEEEKKWHPCNHVCPGYIRTDISLSALQGDGGKHGKMDPGIAQGMSVVECARHILQGVARGKKEIIVGAKNEQGLIYLKRSSLISWHG
jgi:short-subunit dehydrogenase